MRMYHHHINEAHEAGNPRWIHWRGWWRWYTGQPDASDEKQVADIGVEIVAQNPQPEFSARLSVGTRGSETPFDAHLTVLGTGFYLQTEMGRNIAEKLSQHWFSRCTDKNHKWESREINVSVHNGKLWWHLWVHSNHWERGEFPRWRQGSFDLNPLNHLWGQKRYWYEDVDKAKFDIHLEEGSYPIEATLQLQSFGRPKRKRRQTQWVVDVDAPKGIPSHRDHSGGWKGDRTYGFAVPLSTDRANSHDWFMDARSAIAAWVLNYRARTGFREPQPLDS